MPIRVSTAQLFQDGITQINAQQSQLLGLYNQVSSGKQLNSPADDPLGAARAITLATAQSINTQYKSNRGVAEQDLNTEENTLQSVTTLFQSLKTDVVQAGNGTLSDSDRQSLGAVVTTLKQTLLGYANATDANGQYLFSGHQGNVPPFAVGGTGTVTWQGDRGARLIQVTGSRQMSTSDNGYDLFMGATPGDQSYVTQAGAANTGTAVVNTPTITNPADPSVGNNFSVSFSGSPLQATITQTDPTGAPVGSPTVVAYAPGTGTLALSPGVSIAISGTPAAGDTFSVTNVKGQDLNIFTSLDELAAALNTPTGGDQAKLAALHNTLVTVGQRVQSNYNAILTVRSSLGTRLNELSGLDNSGASLDVNYTTQLSGIEDVNYNTAITQLQLRQTALSAASQAFVNIQNLNLFSMNAGH
ncbi:MAG: flagellar hook-associated protein 3 [Candidimonas sp.]|nr:MAG: flagellar hook-associated protein 3 [Candidimonas sp.]